MTEAADAHSAAWFDPGDPAFTRDPYPTYRRLRDEAPAYFHEASGLWFVSRHADVERSLTDFVTISSARGNVVIDSPARVGKTLGSLDPPRHDELRRTVQRGLGAARIDAMLPAVRAATRTRLDELRGRREADLVGEISRPILFGALGRLLGLDAAAAERATALTAELFHASEDPLGPVLPADRFAEIFAFLRAEAGDREPDPAGEDVISALLAAQQAGAPLSDEEIVANISTVLLAGNASIGHFFPNLIHALWRNPDAREALLVDPSRASAAIEEGVRWDTSTQAFARQTTAAMSIGDTVIPADARVVLLYGSANRDERAIEEPDRFDLGRKRIRHFGFGLGPHVCAGVYATRAILRTVMAELMPFLGRYELDLSQATRVRHIMVRGFRTLPIAW